MSGSRVNIDKLDIEIRKRLEEFRDVTREEIEYAVKKTAETTVEIIRDNIHEKGIGDGEAGRYAKSWAYKRDPDMRGKWAYSMVVYSKPPYYRIAHLLEHGHAKRDGGRVNGKPHILPAEKTAERVYINMLRSLILQRGRGGKF